MSRCPDPGPGRAPAEEPESPPRRRALTLLGAMVATVAAGSGAWMGCSSSEQASAPPGGPARFPLSELPPGSRFRLLYQGFPVEVRRAEDGTVAARSLLCTHTGCEVVWMPARQLYHCPCHEGLFDADGRVVSGFPPRPLRDVPARIEGEEVVVGDEA